MALEARLLVLPWAMAAAFSSPALALGLGDIQTGSRLGEPLSAEIPVYLQQGQFVSAECFRLVEPGQDLPWLKQGSFSLNGKLLRLRSARPVTDPILQLAIQVGCGHDLRREYTLMLPPPVQTVAAVPARREDVTGAGVLPGGRPVVEGETPASIAAALYPHLSHAEQRRFARALIRANRHLGLKQSRGVHQTLPAGQELVIPELPPPPPPVRPAPEPAVSRQEHAPPVSRTSESLTRHALPALEAAAGAGDRLVLGAEPGGEVPGLALRLAPELGTVPGDGEASTELQRMRKLLRLEYQMLAFLENHAETASLPPEERLRALESVLGEAAPPVPAATPPAPHAPEPQAPARKPGPVEAPDGEALDWAWLLAGAGLLGGGALLWQRWRRRRQEAAALTLEEEPGLSPARLDSVPAIVDPLDELDLPPAAPKPFSGPGAPLSLIPSSPLLDDVPLAEPQAVPAADAPGKDLGPQSHLDASVDEVFTHNPVMELAEIMLSFGRVKGAAQALQEYIDHNPKEALQPWVKLLDIYRQAGMQAEFESLAKSLNENFNVELLQWSDVPKPGEPGAVDFVLELVPQHADQGAAVRPHSIEGMSHICERIQALWGTEECYRYIQELLRDNRGGTRQGFPLPVVDELLFLSEILLQDVYRTPLAPDIDLSAETL